MQSQAEKPSGRGIAAAIFAGLFGIPLLLHFIAILLS
jgi:hypothetical protein